MKLIKIQKKLTGMNLKVFSGLEFRRVLGVSVIAAQKLLERYTKKGVLVRLKGGLYALDLNFPSAYFIANKLYQPSYISFETALSYYHLIPEIVYTVTSATTRRTREYGVKNINYHYHKILKKAFSGYQLFNINAENVLFAEREKAVADYLYFVFLHKKKLNDRLKLKDIDFKKLISFAALFEKQKFTRWIKNDIRKAT